MSLYKGWSPVVGQRLSFSIVGFSDYPSPSICANVADDSSRHIISYQKRFLSDKPFLIPLPDSIKNFFIRFFWRKDGMHRFLCVASVPDNAENQDSPIKGKVYIYSDKHLWSRNIKKHVKPAVLKLKQYSKSLGSLNEYVEKYVTPLLEVPSKEYLYSVDFLLHRNGVVEITTGLAHQIPEGKLYQIYRENLLHDPVEEKELICQTFFFIKDLAHTHQHHHHRTDTITCLHEYNESDVNWMRLTLKNLYRKVLEYKRIPDKGDGTYNASQGVLAYTDSFANIASELLTEEETKLLPTRHHENISKSIQASQDQFNFQEERSRSFRQAFINSMFALAGIVIALASLAAQDSKLMVNVTGTYIEAALNFVIDLPMESFTLTVLVGYFYVSITGRHSWRGAVITEYGRVLQPFSEKFSSLILFLIGVILAAATYFSYQLIDLAF